MKKTNWHRLIFSVMDEAEGTPDEGCKCFEKFNGKLKRGPGKGSRGGKMN